jgi:RNA polymerase sigma factor (TIGR02999 family)
MGRYNVFTLSEQPLSGTLPILRRVDCPGRPELVDLSYYALRERAIKTVMGPRNYRGTPQSEMGTDGVPTTDRQAVDQLFSVTYEELRRLASTVRRGDPSATLSPTALVNEAWLKLAESRKLPTTSKLHFKRIAARAMRQLLIEAARRRNAGKRGGGVKVTVTFDEALQRAPSGSRDLLQLDRALDDLAKMNPRQAVMVESRFFGGLDVPEIASLLSVSEATVLRDWRAAKAWLAHELLRA